MENLGKNGWKTRGIYGKLGKIDGKPKEIEMKSEGNRWKTREIYGKPREWRPWVAFPRKSKKKGKKQWKIGTWKVNLAGNSGKYLSNFQILRSTCWVGRMVLL